MPIEDNATDRSPGSTDRSASDAFARDDGGKPSAGVPLHVAVLGAAGRMGRACVEAVDGARDLNLVAAVDRDGSIDDLVAAGADVAIDFTTPAATEANVRALIDAGIHAVVGTTGWSDEGLRAIADLLDSRREAGKPAVGVLIAPNFALGAVLSMVFAERAARYYESVEIIELHHPDKVDAPSGTARHTAARIARARKEAKLGPIPDATVNDPFGTRGGLIDGIRVHSVRSRGLIAHQEVLFGGPGEQLTLRHDSLDRSSFMPGVLLAVRTVVSRPGLAVGLEEYLDL